MTDVQRDFTRDALHSHAPESPEAWLAAVQGSDLPPGLLHLCDALWLLANDARALTFRCAVRRGAEALGATVLTYRRRRDALIAAGWLARTPFDRIGALDPDRQYRRGDAELLTLVVPAASDTTPSDQGGVSLTAPRLPLKHNGRGGGSLWAPGHDRWGARGSRRYLLRQALGTSTWTRADVGRIGNYKRPDAVVRALLAERLVVEVAPGRFRWADTAAATGRYRTLRQRHALQRRQWWGFVEAVRWSRRCTIEEREDRLREVREAARRRACRIVAVDPETGEVLAA